MNDLVLRSKYSINCYAAIAYSKMGFSVLPLKPRDKIPILYDWTNKASKEISDIKGWWIKTPDANIGIACGNKSQRLVIIDIDNHNGVNGADNLKMWEHVHGPLPDTVTTKSGSGGFHKWYLLEDDEINILNKVNLIEGVDIRGEGGQVCAPPSIHPNGEPYVFIDKDGHELDIETGISGLSRIAVANETVLELIKEAEEAQEPNWDGVLSDPSNNYVFYNEPTCVTEGGRDVELFKKIASLIGKGLPENEVEYYAQEFNSRVLSPPLSSKIVSKKVANRCRSYTSGHSRECDEAIKRRQDRMDIAKINKVDSPDCPVSNEFNSDLVSPEDAGFTLEGTRHLVEYEVEQNGKIVTRMDYTAKTAFTILENYNILKGILCYNDFKQSVWIRGKIPWARTEDKVDRQLEEIDKINIVALIEDSFGFQKLQRIEDAILIAADHRHVHPVQEWMESMPEWDGVKRLDTILTDMLGVEDNIYTRETASLIFNAMIKRTYEPGCKFDYTPVFVGPQGCGKSTFCRLLTLEHGHSWFMDSLKSFAGVEPVRDIQGKLVVELAELSAMKNSKSQELIKKFIGTQDDSNRKMHQDNVSVYPRRCIFLGSTNTVDFLNDPTGNRRFFPLVTSVENRTWDKPLYKYKHDYLISYMTQVWSEALSRYDENVELVLSDEADKMAFAEQTAHLATDERLETIIEYLDTYESRVGSLTCAHDICSEALYMDESYLGSTQGAGEMKKVGLMLQNSIPEWKSVGRKMVRGRRRKAFERILPVSYEEGDL